MPAPIVKFYFVRDLCDRWGVTRITIWRWEQAGLIPPGHLLRGHKYWLPSEIEQAEATTLNTPHRPVGQRSATAGA